MNKGFKKKCTALGVGLAILSLTSLAYAIPALQLGAGSGDWTYDTSTQTWVTGDNPLNLLATANAIDGNGDFAWASEAPTYYAYLVASSTPKGTGGPAPGTDVLDITVENDGVALGVKTSGYGAPPLSDPNSLAPHGVFDTYFDVQQCFIKVNCS